MKIHSDTYLDFSMLWWAHSFSLFLSLSLYLMDFAPGILLQEGAAKIAASSYGSNVMENLRTPQTSKKEYL